jgi:hypothetical protein
MRPAAASAVLGLALAVGAPTAWALGRPQAAAGPPVDRSPVAASPAPPPPSDLVAGPVPARDAAPATAPQAPVPALIDVPARGIAAPVQPVGVAADGQMALPDDVEQVGWYRFGARPGDAGSAVIAGHVDDRDQGAGALFPLREAEPGDEVAVTDDAGRVTRWSVVSREVLHKEEVPVDALFDRAGPPRLVLITCGGPFLPEHRSYRDNVVVVAEPVEGGGS